MSFLKRLFGNKSKTIGVDRTEPDNPASDDSDAIAWRNKYLEARVKYLENIIDKKGRENYPGLPVFNLPEDVTVGSLGDLEGLNILLAQHIKTLESALGKLDEGK